MPCGRAEGKVSAGRACEPVAKETESRTRERVTATDERSAVARRPLLSIVKRETHTPASCEA